VGGDLFDAFFVAPERLFFCVGDVSGHGIPAAMFMARAVSLMRMVAFSVTNPAVLLERVNDQLCAGNDANMFVSLFCGMLDTGTGQLTYANAGHLAPILVRSGHAEPLLLPKGMIIGVAPGIPYRSAEAVLSPNEILLCFTDGVTEAQTPAGEEFTEPALARFIEQTPSLSLEDLLTRVRAEVTRFTATTELIDDCTLLAIRRGTS
jgi:sigma-B regulation protein RsbU (phosphoserine phosphatase)